MPLEVRDVVSVVDVVALVVPVLVTVVVGVVTWHSLNPPATHDSVITFSVCATATHFSPGGANKNLPNAHFTTTGAPAGPLNSRAAELMAAAVSSHCTGSVNIEVPLISSSQLTVPVSLGHAARILLRTPTCALQL